MIIREETIHDRSEVFAVNVSAFQTPAEAGLVDVLREQARPVISLVAETHGEIAGHLMLSPVLLSKHPTLKLMGLAPMAVRPDYQSQGIGSALVRAGLESCLELGVAGVVVLGHPKFYPRFGFAPASRFGIDSEYDVPDDVFMVLELESGALEGKTGRVSYHSAFGDL
jgi:putative acetyltransferase